MKRDLVVKGGLSLGCFLTLLKIGVSLLFMEFQTLLFQDLGLRDLI